MARKRGKERRERTKREEIQAAEHISSFYMPEDILIEVLSILPLKTLARFRCVSKQWELLILNTITMKSTSSKLLIFSKEFGHIPLSLHSLDHQTCIERVSFPFDERVLRGHKVQVHSSCYGLVLVQIDHDLFLWNLLTKVFRKVLTYDTSSWKDYKHGYRSKAELFFDSVTNECKVMFMECNNDGVKYFYVAACWASSWEKINIPFQFESLTPGPFFRGNRHWFSQYRDSIDTYYSYNIYYFDPLTNQLIEVPKPNFKNGDENTIKRLGVVDGCLCMTRINGPGYIEFLKMKEYGNGDSWEVMFVISNWYICHCDRSINHHLHKTKEPSVKKLVDNNGGVNSDLLWGILALNCCFEVILYEETLLRPSQYVWENCDYLSNPVDQFKEILGFDSEDFEFDYLSDAMKLLSKCRVHTAESFEEIMPYEEFDSDYSSDFDNDYLEYDYSSDYSCDYGSVKYFEEIMPYFLEDYFDYEGYINTNLSQIVDLSSNELRSRRKKKNKRRKRSIVI